MFTQIKTSKANREVVAQLTRKLSLGAENTIARIAFMYSISKERKMDLTKIQDFGGKEYSKSVLFGDYFDIYLGLLCTHYRLYKTDKDIPKYVKMHVDDGLQILEKELYLESNSDGFNQLITYIKLGLDQIK
ncbi:MAG: DndE family protein [Bacteroidales bacterium]|nr:DndE family protein [Bacteroidales bacterium]